ncbi:MAG TPA: PA14 domain-containing protein [Pirellulales bacterium]|nr:PA14 domain-containing protein [Pirellulales bacterium]
MSTPENFDPYRKWLGIPPAEQPPNHYRLLALGPFEDDPEVIESAVDQRMAHIRTFQTGPHSALSQKLLNELATARLTLLNAAKKAVYDDQLRAQLPAPAAPAKVSTPAATTPAPIPLYPTAAPAAPIHMAGQRGPAPVAIPQSAPAAAVSTAAHPRRPRSRTEPAVWAGLAAAAVALAAAVYWASGPVKREIAGVFVAQPDSPTSAPIENKGRPPDGGSDSNAPTVMPPPNGEQAKSSSAEDRRSPNALSNGTGANRLDETPGDEPGSKMPAAPVPFPSSRSATSLSSKDASPASLADLLNRADSPPLTRPHRVAPPEGKALAAANADFLQKYGKQVAAAKTPQAARKVKVRLGDLARHGAEPADLRFVMLGAAGVVAANLGQIGPAYNLANEMSRQFEVDAYDVKLKAVQAAGKYATTPAAFAVGALQTLALAERAALEGRFDVASRAISQAAGFARKTKDKDLIAQVGALKAAQREQSLRNAEYLKALTDLKKSPDDPAANLAAGKYETLALGNRRAGLLKLADSNDPQFAAIARLEAAALGDPRQWAPLAAAWRQAAAEQDEFFQLRCLLEARYAWLRAKSSVGSRELPTGVVEELQAAGGYPLARLRPGVAAQYYEGADFQRLRAERADSSIEFHFGQGSPEPSVPNNFFSARWTGFIKPPVSGRYRITTLTDDSVRVWIDGKLIIDRWGQNAGVQYAFVELTSELHAFRMEYNDTFDVAVAMLSWNLADFADPDYLQWTTLDALYYDPDSPFQTPELGSP